MSVVRVEYSEHIPAPAEQVYGILIDFEEAHPAILPKQYFREVKVFEGGQGAGTKYHLKMAVGGQTYDYEMHVSEPEPGRELLEVSSDGQVRTTMRVDPAGQECRVTIISEFAVAKGPIGWLQRLFQPAMVRRIYRQELDILRQYVREGSPSTAA